MRNRRGILLLLIIALACAAGGYWYSVNSARQQMARSTPLRVLCADNWLSAERLNRFSQRHYVGIEYFTYSRPSEFLRQMANADGKIDVICTSSWLLRSLARSHWLKRLNYVDLSNARALSVDFLHMPFDRRGEYGVPLFWNIYVYFGRQGKTHHPANRKSVKVWAAELNVLNDLLNSESKFERHLQDDENHDSANDLKSYAREVAGFWPSTQAFTKPDDLIEESEWAQIPLSQVAGFLAAGSEFQFSIPEQGAPVELGLLAVGEKSVQPRLALQLINELLGSDHALEVQRRLHSGVVHKTLDNVDQLSALQRPQALRQIPLNRLRFPDLNVEYLPRFEKLYDETIRSSAGNE